MQSIPASEIITINPGVIGAGGAPLSLNGLFLTESTRVPIGTVLALPTLQGVEDYFGADSEEANQAAVYFAGFDSSNIKPGTILFTQYPEAAVSGWARGGVISSLTLTQLRAITGVITVDIDGTPTTSANIDLSAATSFSNAASIINQALAVAGPTAATYTGSISGTLMTVSATISGIIQVGQVISGAGVTDGTFIVSQGTGQGGTGTYVVSVSQSVAGSTAITSKSPLVTYDSVQGSFLLTSPNTGVDSSVGYATGSASTGLRLTQATGTTLSPGAVAASPTSFMDGVAQQVQNWATFTTIWEPTVDDKVSFANWNSLQDERFAYCMGETDVSAQQPDPTGTAGYQIQAENYGGVAMLWQPTNDAYLPAFVMGSVASIDFGQFNGRTNLCFRQRAGQTVGVRDATIARQLITNGYSYYGAYATATEAQSFLYDGQITGPFSWMDSYVNQINLNAALQQALLNLVVTVKSIPYNDAGYTLIRQACADPINEALSFGTIRQNVPLSSAQAAEVNNAAGVKIDGTLATQGWYLQILAANATQRSNRTSPPITLWYMDGQSVQSINMGSILIQ